MKPTRKSPFFCLAFFCLFAPVWLLAQAGAYETNAPLFLQLNKSYFVAGDTVTYYVHTVEQEEGWYLLDVFHEAGSGSKAAHYGTLKKGASFGKIGLPDSLREGVYWARLQAEGGSRAFLIPLYVFEPPKQLTSGAGEAVQLRITAKTPKLFAGSANQLSYQVWPEPVYADGRIVVRNGKGAILLDTLLSPSGKGVIRLTPDSAGTDLAMELWIEGKRLKREALPELVPLSFSWSLTDTLIHLSFGVQDSLQKVNVRLTGPDSFSWEESIAHSKSVQLNYAAWPSGRYTLRLLVNNDTLYQEPFWLREKGPGIEVVPGKVLRKGQALVEARLRGVPDFSEASWQLRVYSEKQQSRPVSLSGSAPWKALSATAAPSDVPSFVLQAQSDDSGLRPLRLEGTVRDSLGKPLPAAVVSLSGENMGHFYYTLSDKEGRFSFRGLPVERRSSYLLAFDQHTGKKGRVVTEGPLPPASLPPYRIDSAALQIARSFAYAHYLLKLLQQKEPAEKTGRALFPPLKLYTPEEWTDTYLTSEYIAFPGLGEFLQEAIPGLRVQYKNGRASLQVLTVVSSRKKIYFQGEPLYLLNGYPLPDADALLSVPSSAVDSVLLVRKNAVATYGRLAKYGVVAVYTKPEAAAPALLSRGAWLPGPLLNTVDTADRMTIRKESPTAPDFAEVLQWLGEVEIQQEGSFYFPLEAGHEAGTFVLALTGFYPGGKVIRLRQSIEIAPAIR